MNLCIFSVHKLAKRYIQWCAFLMPRMSSPQRSGPSNQENWNFQPLVVDFSVCLWASRYLALPSSSIFFHCDSCVMFFRPTMINQMYRLIKLINSLILKFLITNKYFLNMYIRNYIQKQINIKLHYHPSPCFSYTK